MASSGGFRGPSRKDNKNGRHANDSLRGRKLCFYFQKTGYCKFRNTCKFSHDVEVGRNRNHELPQRKAKAEDTPEAREARTNYSSWRALIRRLPPGNDIRALENLWSGALDILNGSDRDWKQNLPIDLDNDSDYQGRYHMRTLLETRARPGQYENLVKASHAFFLVMTHSAMVDCLSVDAYVGSLYSFMSGANGTRAVPFFRHICETVVTLRTDTTEDVSLSDLDCILMSLVAVVSELLRRESRARYNQELPDLINSLETATALIGEKSRVASSTIHSRVRDIRAMISRANSLLSDNDDAENGPSLLSRNLPAYPRSVAVPGGRHDNDHDDITKINIFPTRQEIMSEAREFLPSTDPDQPHFLESKGERHIDTHFRLLRHDTFGTLVNALGSAMRNITNDPSQLENPRFDLIDTHTYTYSHALVSFVLLDRRAGLQARLSFRQPQSTRRSFKSDRCKWWEDSRRLEEGVLISFIWMQDNILQHLFFTVANKSTDDRNVDSLTHSSSSATITLKLMTQDQSSVEALLDLSRRKSRGVLLEYPHVLPATFRPVLENLQNMQRLGRLPFREWILPDRIDGQTGTKLDVPPPLYARHAGFTFPLTSILKDNTKSLTVVPSSSIDIRSLVANLEENSELDRGQCEALVAALTREFAFIQGPPGTGKSYLGIKLMNILLDIKKLARLGPIVVVCYTNHALDQFLEHLVKMGILKIIRVGGQSRSDILKNHNLRNITQTEGKSRHEKWQAATAYQELSDCEAKVKTVLGRLHGSQKRKEWRNFQHHLYQNYREIHAQFSEVDEDGFTHVGRHPFEIWTDDVEFSGDLEISAAHVDLRNVIHKAIVNARSLNPIEKRMLVDTWTEELQQEAADQFFEIVKESEKAQHSLRNVHEEVDRRVLQDADVIGLTTTGLAKNISTLQHVRAKVVICEEAGEVMEPHLISALLPTVEHFIQIGDHEQLRPSINNFRDLSLESDQGILYQLDRSQFERLSVGEPGRPTMPVAQLNVQRRMRPQISRLIRETVYERLLDHDSTTTLPDVVGLRKNVFWFNHENVEDQKQNELHHKKSKSNSWEVAMVHALVRHVVRQGVYNSSDIAVLTPYTGQLQRLRAAMRNDFEIVLSDRDQDALNKDGFSADNDPGDQVPSAEHQNRKKPLMIKKLSELLRIATVDNFQGEEAKIIIVSLVRSNEDRKVGFLKTPNRINVLLSRAQHGMYLVGNADTYSNIPMWNKVMDLLRTTNAIGQTLELCCPRHVDTPIYIRTPDDFAKFSPEGGCREACNDRLPDCGHRCQARCHSEALHDAFKCEQPCQRRYSPCNHPCQKPTCGEDCGKCMISLNEIQLPCGHFKDGVPCHLAQTLDLIPCRVIVEKIVPGCHHTVKVQCCEDVERDGYRCSIPCEHPRPCGHACPGSCGRCRTYDEELKVKIEHAKCTRACGRRFGTCNHTCPRICHEGSDCGLCMAACEVACKHSRCRLRCHEACAPCIEPCAWSCGHQNDCTMPCSAPCNRLPCNERCTRTLACGHQCPGLCGEDCLSDYCKECGTKLDARVDMLEMKEYRDIDLNDTTIVALSCGHFFTTETLDGVVGLAEVYKFDEMSGEIIDLKDIPSELSPAVPKCPDCSLPIRQYVTQRYNRLINRAVIDEMSKRFIVTGQTGLRQHESALVALENELEGSRSSIESNTSFSIMGTTEQEVKIDVRGLEKRYKKLDEFRASLMRLQKSVSDRHQPAHKLHEATIHAVQRTSAQSSLEAGLASLSTNDIPKPADSDNRITLGARVLEVRLFCVTMEDKFHILTRLKSKHGAAAAFATKFSGGSPIGLTKPFLQLCASLIHECKESSLLKICVEATLYYARIARLFETSGLTDPDDRKVATEYHDSAMTYLQAARELCGLGFNGHDSLLLAVRESMELMRKEWYEAVTPEEIAAIKKAMVSGRGGIATHSGHWYNCRNGHPFAIGECGMPMELARCPECGAAVGGQSHQAAAGVTRAENMER